MAQMMTPFRPGAHGGKDEEKIYSLLERELDDAFQVYHSINLPANHKRQHHQDREIDFLIIHPSYGLLVIETKGGKIVIKEGKWFSIDRNKVEHEIVSPDSQIKDAMFMLKYYLGDHVETKSLVSQKTLKDIIHRAIWLQYSDATSLHIPELASHQILDKRSFDNVQDNIIKAFGSRKLPTPMDPALIIGIKHALVPTNALLPNADSLKRANTNLDTLTHEQLAAFHYISTYKQVIVYGEAGTGKTYLAVSLAKKFAETGAKVLYLCITKYQLQFVRLIAEHFEIAEASVEFYDLNSFARLVCDAVGFEETIPEQVFSTKSQEIINKHLSNAIYRSRGHDKEAWKYDVVLIDEGQDFDAALRNSLQMLSSHRPDSHYCIFVSEQQRFDFDDDHWKAPFQGEIFTALLNKICRNVYDIAQLMHMVLQPDIPPFEEFTVGEDVIFVDIPDQSKEHIEIAMKKTLEQLITEGIAPESILVISGMVQTSGVEERISHYKSWDQKKIFQLERISPNNIRPEGKIGFSTIRAAKGLENDIVILVELEGMKHEKIKRRKNLLYTALSRAKVRLIIIGSKRYFYDLLTIDDAR